MAGTSTRSKTVGTRAKSMNEKTSSATATKRGRKKPECICEGAGKDKRMICCDLCQIWYHFDCIKLTDDKAEQIELFICDSCHETTGKTSSVHWEGGGEVVAAPADEEPEPPEPVEEEAEDSPKGDDDYDATVEEEPVKPRASRLRRNTLTGKRRSVSNRISDSDDSSSERASAKLRKRKASAPPPAEKSTTQKTKKNSDKASATSDPVRKYVIGKFSEIISAIFSQYADGDDVEKEATDYANELEECVYEFYSETGGSGKTIAGAKYKERFRMLSFNLEQKDRVLLFQRITSGKLPASELCQMSSAELANEQLRQQIETAQEASLQSSILKEGRDVPRAKITHKGEEIIEDVTGERDIARAREADYERDLEREEEHQHSNKRLKIQTTVEPSPGAEYSLPTASASITLPTPVSPVAMQQSPYQSTLPLSNSPPVSPTFDVHDIKVDVDLPESPPASASTAEEPSATTAPATLQTSPVSPTTPSFNLSSLSWGESTASSNREDNEAPPSNNEGPSASSLMDLDADIDVDINIEDQDFSMFTDAEPTPARPEAPAKPTIDKTQALFDSTPHVWNGEVVLPKDNLPAATPGVIGRQIGGSIIEASSPIWRALFPSNSTRIEGRVAVEEADKYLVNVRFNTGRTLVGVAFTPRTEQDKEAFDDLSNYLKAKGRCGVTTPWSRASAEDAPGKELYFVPVAKDEPLPECIELLDNVKLPKERRSSDILVGLFVLYKAKLEQLQQQYTSRPSISQPIAPQQPPPFQAPPQQSPADFSKMLQLLGSLPPNLHALLPNSTAIAGGIPASLSSGSPYQYPPGPSTSFAPYPGGMNAPNPAVAPYPPFSQGPPPTSNYPRQAAYSPPRPQQYSLPRQSAPSSGWDRRRSPPPGPRGGYGDRGGGRRGGDDRFSRNREFEQNRDSGWGNRGRGRGRGGGGGGRSPPRSSYTDPNLTSGNSGWGH